MMTLQFLWEKGPPKLTAQQSAWHPYLKKQDSKQEKGRESETVAQGTAISALIPMSERTHLLCGKVKSVRILNADTHSSYNKTSLAYIIQYMSTAALCRYIYIQIFLL